MVTETSRADLIPSYKIGFEISTDSSNFVKHAKLFREDLPFSFLGYLHINVLTFYKHLGFSQIYMILLIGFSAPLIFFVLASL